MALTRQEKQLYKKIGGGIHRYKGKKYKKDDTFYAYPSEISETMKRVLLPIEDIAVQLGDKKGTLKPPKTVLKQKPEEVLKPNKPYLEKKGAWYKVFLGDGTQAHDGSLRKEPAEELLASLLEE